MKLFSFLFLFISSCIFAQEVAEKFRLTNQLSENSGLIYFDGKIITHNDSGGKSNLYELDAATGKILRTVTIANASNIDWEDIAHDENYIYISDSGNNKGNRTNLKIYRISKKEYLNSTFVTAEIINYSYSDQKDFRYSSKNNFDAEALIVYQNNLLIFSKNRGDNKTKIYKIPKTIGTHIAQKINTLDVEGQITGATYNHKTNNVVLCGYTSALTPFLIVLDDFDIKNKSFVKIDLSEFVGAISQVEGISFSIDDEILLSRERFRKKIGGFSIDITPAVFVFNKEEWNISQKKSNKYIRDFLNGIPFKRDFEVLEITNELGEVILKKSDTIKPKSIRNLSKENYFIKFKTGIYTVNQKLIKQ